MRWRLLDKHYINDMMLEAGTEVGSGTDIAFSGPPSMLMEPADKEAEEFAKKNPHRLGGNLPSEVRNAPPPLQPGQRVGGMGPKAENVPVTPGQGPVSASELANRAMIDKAT